MRFITISLLLFLCISVKSQTYKPFRVELGGILNVTTNDEVGNGAGVYIEPRVGLNDQFLFGFRGEYNNMSFGNISVNLTGVEIESVNVNAHTLFGEYFFNNNKTRPFVGMGLGVYTKKNFGIDVSTTSIQIGNLDRSVSNFGFSPRVGLNSGHFRMLATLNFTGSGITNYYGINIGIEIGGGRVKEN